MRPIMEMTDMFHLLVRLMLFYFITAVLYLCAIS